MNAFGRAPVDEMSLLGWLHNLGATDEERALTAGELAERMGLDLQDAWNYLEKLIELEYISALREDGDTRFYLNPQGILRVARTYT